MALTVPARLELRGITKRFPGVLANDSVGFAVAPGEIHALLGENGAGKSTLVKMIYGVMAPDAGEMAWNGQPVAIANPRAARRLGIGMVFQHFSLFEAMTVLENIALGLDKRVSQRDLEAEIRRVLETYGLKLDPRRIVSTLSVGERQRIEIVRALLLDPKLLIMDEPTSVLTPQEVEQLFETLRKLSAGGCSILYISHKLHEIVALCQVATILRAGKVVAKCDPRKETSKSMAELMIGANLKEIVKVPGRTFGAAKLSVSQLSLLKRGDFGVALKDIGFTVRAGEIFGIAGVAGNGQNELLAALSGEVLSPPPASILLNGGELGRLGPNERRTAGLCAVPEERNGHAAVADFSLADNTVLTARGRMGLVNRAGLISAGKASAFADRIIAAFDVKAQGAGASGGSLSGGNLQKFIMGREIDAKPKLLIVSQPTWGVDVGAAAQIRGELLKLAEAGCAVLIVSEELDELFEICDRMYVMAKGQLSPSLPRDMASTELVGQWMSGLWGHTPIQPVVRSAA